MTFSPELFTSILQEQFKLVNGKLAQKKWTLQPDSFTSILQVCLILVNSKLAEKKKYSIYPLSVFIAKG